MGFSRWRGGFRANSLYFPRDQGISESRDSFASASQHSQPVAGFLALSQPSATRPVEARKCATEWRSFSRIRRERDRVCGRTPRFSRFISSGHFRGSHLPRSRWSHDQLSIMMYIEVRIRCSQPPSRGVSRSLPTFSEAPGRSPEMCHQSAVVLRVESRETVLAHFPAFYLSGPVLGVTPAGQRKSFPMDRAAKCAFAVRELATH